MGNALHHFPAQKRRESRLETRAILRQLLGGKGALDEISQTALHDREVASFILKCTKSMWAASSSAQLDNLTGLLEKVFCEAFVAAGGSYSQAIELFEKERLRNSA